MNRAVLNKWLSYTPQTGVFTWLQSPSRAVKAGDVAGHVCSRGYVTIGLFGRVYKAHRLAFLAMGSPMPAFVDHIDRNKTNNKWRNLRPATRAQNAANTRKKKRSSTGFTGVYALPSGKFYATIQVNKRAKYLGSFAKATDAKRAYDTAARANFGAFAPLEAA